MPWGNMTPGMYNKRKKEEVTTFLGVVSEQQLRSDCVFVADR